MMTLDKDCGVTGIDCDKRGQGCVVYPSESTSGNSTVSR